MTHLDRTTHRRADHEGIRGRPTPPVASPPPHVRRLIAAQVRKLLGPPVEAKMPGHVDVITDLSGSMFGGNDVTGCRHEAALIGFEHLARTPKVKRRPAWSAQLRSFDLTSPLDWGRTDLDRRGLRDGEAHLLAASLGGSSNLGPSLAAAETQAPDRRRLLVVMSDFELFDPDVTMVLHGLVNSSADEVVALVFNNPVPPSLVGTRVHAVSIARDDPPALVAQEIIDGARRLSSRPAVRQSSAAGSAGHRGGHHV